MNDADTAAPIKAGQDVAGGGPKASRPRVWIERLVLTTFRNHERLEVKAGPGPVVITGPNGAGKTNILEAVSLLSPGQGLRRAVFADMARQGSGAAWSVAARVHADGDVITIGTGLEAGSERGERAGRTVRIDGEAQPGSGVLADVIDLLWLTPVQDGLFTGPAADRRRFLDRLVLCFDPAHRTRAGHFERAMRQRNRLLETGSRRDGEFAGLERVLAETGVAIAAARRAAVATVCETIERRRTHDPSSPFPWAAVVLEGELDAALAGTAAVDV